MHHRFKQTGRLWLALVSAALLVLGIKAQAQSSLKLGLVAYWDFDNSDFKDSVGKFDGTANGTNPILFVDGKPGFGKAIQLDGADQFVEITGRDATYDPDQLAFEGGSVSIAGWFTVGTFDKTWQALVAKGEGSNWRVARNGATPGMSYAGGLTDALGTKDVTDGNWHQFVAISDAAGASFGTAIYIDGALDGQIAGQAALTANQANMKIGDNPGATGRYWNGKIDDLAIWNRVLTESEISVLYAAGVGKPLSSILSGAVGTSLLVSGAATVDDLKVTVVDNDPVQFDPTASGNLNVTIDGKAATPASKPKANGQTTLDFPQTFPNIFGSKATVKVHVEAKATSGSWFTNDLNVAAPAYVTVPADSKLATAATDSGMSVTTFQLGQDENGNVVNRTDSWGDDQGGNRIFKAEQELVGGFFDFSTGKAYPNNVVTQGGTAKNNVNLVNWEQAAGDVAGEHFGSATTPADTAIPNDPIPGISPGNYDDYIAAEVVTYLRFPSAGLYRMGVSSDDGFQVTAGQLGPFGAQLGIADVGRGVSESTFEFVIPAPGDYPFRLVWMEGTGGANCEWYMIDRTTSARYLINGPQNNPLAVKAFRTAQPRAYVQSISPANNYYFVDAKKPLTINLADGSTQVANGSVKLLINGNDVTSAATVQKNGTITTVSYLPANGFAFAKNINGQLIWQESTTPATTWTNNFRFGVGGPFPYEFPSGSFWIEAEDFDNSGKEPAVVDTMPYTGDGMNGLGAVPNVDYVNDDATSDTATIYRFANGDGSTSLNPYVAIATSTTAMLSMIRPQNTTMTANYKIGWSGDPDAYNYTRKVPAGVYTAYAGLSYDDGDTSPFDQPSRVLAPLSVVTAGTGTTTQTYQSIGSFQGPSTGGWSANNLAPLNGPDGTPAFLKISAPSTTFHVNVPSGDWDYFILMPVTGVSAKFTGTTPDLRFPISRNAVIKWAFEDYSTTINTASAKLSVNGASVPAAQVTANKSGTTTTVAYTPAGLFDIGKTIPFSLTIQDSGGATLTNSGSFMAHFMPASPTNMFLIEAEDFNLNGTVKPAVNTMPYLGNAYYGLSAAIGIDYNRTDNTPGYSLYRTNMTVPVPVSLQNDANGTVRAEDASGNPTWVLTNNFRLGWSGTGFWQDYTRQVPQGDYQVWASMSYGEAPSSTIRAIGNLRTVTSDATKTNQTTQVLGYFRGPATGGWGANQLVPLRLTTDATGDAAVVALGGPTTFQFEYASSDFDYFMLVPATGGTGGGGNIKITSFELSGGNLTIQWTGGGTLQSTTDISKTFTDIPGATTGSYSTPTTGAHQFFRVHQ